MKKFEGITYGFMDDYYGAGYYDEVAIARLGKMEKKQTEIHENRKGLSSILGGTKRKSAEILSFPKIYKREKIVSK